MDLICKITDENIGEKTIKMENPKLRLGARGIVVRDDGKIAVFNKSNKNEYKLPRLSLGKLYQGSLYPFL